MAIEPGEVSSAFLRQRRSLIVVSLGILLLDVLQLRFTKVNFLGNSADIENGAAVPVVLWVVWAYFLSRYLQYMNALGDLGFSTEFSHRLERVMKLYGQRRFRDDRRGNVKGRSRVTRLEADAEGTKPFGGTDHDWSKARWSPMAVEPLPGGGFEVVMAAVDPRPHDQPWDAPRVIVKAQVPMGLLPFFRAWSALGVIGLSPLASEYALPLALASGPVLYALYSVLAR